jgi:hypothetical protein
MTLETHGQGVVLTRSLMALSKVIDTSDMGSPFTVSSKGSYVSFALSPCQVNFTEKYTSWPFDDLGIGLSANVFTALVIIKTKVILPTATKHEENSIFNIGVNSLANCLSFLDQAEVLPFITSPLSKTWKKVYCNQGYLWKALYISEPFYAKENIVEGQFRLLYTRFVRCITYFKRTRTCDPQAQGNNIFP